jgi:uncharacterized protein (DUF1778 family)
MTANTKISLRVTEQQKQRYIEAANRKGQKLTSWIICQLELAAKLIGLPAED